MPDGAFDGAICVQVLEYVDEATEALAEIHRALRPGGRIVVWDVDWGTLSLHARDEERNARVLRAWDEHLVHPALPRTLGARLRAAGFADVRMGAHAFAAVQWDPEFYGVGLLPLIAAFVPGRLGLSEDDARAWLDEQADLGPARRALRGLRAGRLHGDPAARIALSAAGRASRARRRGMAHWIVEP